MEDDEGDEIDAGVAMIAAGIDLVITSDLTRLSSTRFTTAQAKIEAQRRRFEPVDQHLLVEAVTRGLAGEYARSSPADLLVELLRITPGEARARLWRAAELGPRRGFTGMALDPILPATSHALAAGEISGAHADVIIKAVKAIPDALEAEFGGIVERALVEQSRHVHPGLVAKAAEQLLDRIDPDGRAPKTRNSSGVGGVRVAGPS